MEKKRSVQSKLLIILAIVCAVVWLFPYLYLISSSFKPGAEVVSIPAKFFPTILSVENFKGLFERMPAFHYIFNSFLVAVCSTLIAVILGSLSSYAIQRSGAKIATFLIVVVLCLKMIPTSSIAVPIYELITNLGLYDTRVALIIVYAAINMPFVMWVMLGFYEGIPTSIDEAACMDGASSLQTFIKIILPICTPGLATAFVFTLFLSWNEFLLSLLLTSTEAKTFTVGLSEFLSAYSMDLGPMCAGALIFSLPVMVLSIVAQRFIVQGITAGSVKS
ncbi:carbohydrate ABC transporter permease [Enterococcus hulanensis]|uniref:carbohydrate ABC transporter permease n=1 Tax=Enterococcus TaxID=1350 RepID=UPI001A8D3E79|nr:MULTISPECIES: carbohydrate ABC transporter permease [Enterococcus]MBO0457214.1 carbohydrate ABC transporter permease [Enterococcus hulanensis]MBX8937028.1 carbohydrate ABC transporter permease [Enterococcus gilvus]